MIRFDNWTIQADGDILARQFDNLTRTITVAGDIPSGWDWAMLVQVGEAMDIILLDATDGALSAVLTAQQLSISGYYNLQLRGTQGEKVKHTNTVNVYIPASLSGDEQWPTIPSEFTELERRVYEAAKEAESYMDRAPSIGENGNWWEWDGEAYVDTGNPSRGEQGLRGEKGETGDVGPVGPQGERGPKGDPGELTRAQGNALYANALKGKAGGEVVRLDDVSPLEHTVPVKVSGADGSTVVKAQGKNLFDYKAWVEWSKAVGGNGKETATYLGEECFSYLLWRESGTRFFTDIDFKENTQYTFTLEWSFFESSGLAASVTPLLVYYTDGSYSGILPYRDNQTKFHKATFVSDAGKTVSHLSVNRYGATCTVYVKKNMQIEVGNTATEYEPYMEPVSYPVQPVYGDNIFDVQSIDSADIYTTKVNGEDAFCTSVESTELPVHFEPSTQYVVSFEVACPSVPDGWRVKGSAFVVGHVDATGTFSPEEVGFIKTPYDEFQKIEWVSPPGTSIDFLTFNRPIIEDPDGFLEEYTTAAIKTNMTIRPVSAECEVPSIYPTMTLTTDTDGAVLDCEYNRDINKVIEQLTQAIISMGGNI